MAEMGRKKTVSDEAVRAAFAVDPNRSQNAIARELGLSPSDLSYRRKQLEIPPRPHRGKAPGTYNIPTEEVQADRDSGESLRQIGKRRGRHHSAIGAREGRRHMDPRPKGRRPKT